MLLAVEFSIEGECVVFKRFNRWCSRASVASMAASIPSACGMEVYSEPTSIVTRRSSS